MGNDGGSIPKRDDLVKTKDRSQKFDKHQKESTRWKFCSLSKRSLEEPIVSDPLGKLYNKSSVIEFLLDRDHFGEDGKQVAGHLVSLKDLTDLRLSCLDQKSKQWICPITLKEIGSGSNKVELRWIYLIGCGCVLTEVGFNQIKKKRTDDGSGKDQKDECPVCGGGIGSDFQSSMVTINPSPEEEESMIIKLLTRRKSEREQKEKRKQEKKKRKKDLNNVSGSNEGGEGKLSREGDSNNDDNQQSSKKIRTEKLSQPQRTNGTSHQSSSSSNPSNISSSSMSKISQEIQKETHQNLVKLSSTTLKSIYGPRDENGKQTLGQQKESWMTRGTWTRYAA